TGPLRDEFKALKETMDALAERLAKVEARVSVTPDVERVATVERRLSELQGDLKVLKAALTKTSRRLADRVRKTLADYGVEDLVEVSTSLGDVLVSPKIQGADQRIEELLQRFFDVERVQGGWVIYGERPLGPLEEGLRAWLGG
ncbi:MAG: hypothetical protein DRJ56_08625, partial [Thermoprotei archaeon]